MRHDLRGRHQRTVQERAVCTDVPGCGIGPFRVQRSDASIRRRINRTAAGVDTSAKLASSAFASVDPERSSDDGLDVTGSARYRSGRTGIEEAMSTEALALFALVVLVFFLVVGHHGLKRRRRYAATIEPEPALLLLRAPHGEIEEPVPRARRLSLPELRPKQVTICGPSILLDRATPTRHPIVLAHGYMGFDAIGLRARRGYFRGIRERLEALGHTVHVVRVAPAAGVIQRAAQLAAQIRNLRAERVNIIAHSMGGLDARYAIALLGLDARVASLTTIGTPHRGTPLADTGTLWLGEWRQVRQMLDTFGANVDGLYDLTTQRMAEFNRAVHDVRGVFYSSVVGAVSPNATALNALLAPGHAYLMKRVGSNDGIVPAESQKWGEVLGEVDADHWEQIGWSGSFDAQKFYTILAEHLGKWGL